jgi:hypothetical protein
MPNILKFTPQKRSQFLELLRAGNTINGAAEAIGVSYWTILGARHRSKKFDTMVRRARRVATSFVEDALYQEAVKGNVTAQIFYLANRTRNEKNPDDRWENVSHIRHAGDEEAPPIKLEAAQPDWSRLSVDELRTLRDLQNKALENVAELKHNGPT